MASLLTVTGIDHDRGAAQLVLDRTRHTIDYYGNYFNTLRRYHRNYLSALPKGPRPIPPDADLQGGEDDDWHSKIFIPYSFGTIEAATPRLVFSHFSRRPYIQMVGRNREDHAKSSKVTSLLDYDIDRSAVAYKSILAFKSFLKFGLTIGRVTYKRHVEYQSTENYRHEPVFDEFGMYQGMKTNLVKGRKEIRKFDGPWYEPVSVFNYFPDPLFYEVDEMRYMSELQLGSFQRLKEQDDDYYNLTGKHLYMNLDRLKTMPRGEALTRAGMYLGDSREETAEVFGYGFGGNRVQGYMGGPFSESVSNDELWLLHYWEKDRYVVLANGTEVIRDGDNPYDDNEFPYFAANCFPIEFEFYGQGMLHATESLQEEVNAIRQISLDQTKLNMSPPLAYSAEMGMTDLDFDIYPGASVPVLFENGKPLAMPLYQGQMLPPDAQRLEALIVRDWQNALGMNDYVVGGGSGDAGTASEAQMMTAAAATRFKLQSFIGQERFLKQLARKMFARRQQFFDAEEVIRIMGREGYDFPVLAPEAIAGEYDFIPMGSVTGPNREVRLQQLVQFVTTAAANPVMAQRLNWDAILEELVLGFDIQFPERFIQGPNTFQLPPQYLERVLQMAMKNGDKELVNSVALELGRMQQQMEQAMPSPTGGPNTGTMAQESGAPQGAGQIAAGPGGGAPTMGGLQARAMGGPGVGTGV